MGGAPYCAFAVKQSIKEIISFRQARIDKLNQVNKGGKFLKKLWCCSVGVLQDNLVLSTGLMMWIGHRKEIRKLTFRALAFRLSESIITIILYCITALKSHNIYPSLRHSKFLLGSSNKFAILRHDPRIESKERPGIIKAYSALK